MLISSSSFKLFPLVTIDALAGNSPSTSVYIVALADRAINWMKKHGQLTVEKSNERKELKKKTDLFFQKPSKTRWL